MAAGFAASAIACGGGVAVAPDASIDGPAESDAVVAPSSLDGASRDGGSPAEYTIAPVFDGGTSACPPSPPARGTACDASAGCGVDLQCEYDDDDPLNLFVVDCHEGQVFVPSSHPRFDAGDAGCPPTFDQATLAASCSAATCVYPAGTCLRWQDDAFGLDGGFTDGAARRRISAARRRRCFLGCPPSLATALAEPHCTPPVDSCQYAGGSCAYCATGADGGATWSCLVPDPGCPAQRPGIGSACPPAMRGPCNYVRNGECNSTNPNVQCSCGGVWVSAPSVTCE